MVATLLHVSAFMHLKVCRLSGLHIILFTTAAVVLDSMQWMSVAAARIGLNTFTVGFCIAQH